MTRTVLVTGVSSGIGRAQAQLFLENGYEVYGIDKRENPSLAGAFHFLRVDIRDTLAPLFDWLPEVEILCNTAGKLDDYKPLLDISEAEIEDIFAVNLLATMRITRFYLAKMLEKRAGIIINMCSIASFLAGGGGVAYTTSKHALAGFTKQLALDYADKGIQIFGLAPGAVKTAMTANDFEEGGLADWVAAETPIKRWLEPEEIADVSLFLASGKASAMQGEILKIDGGWSLK
ncbi:3-oxoacyl-ACP reductase [Streptococcus cuniculi]|uniref:3-oxoacyl-ACP reductase n=1 Tax=Streptococcus cuniculi TaxID=1432788 RepID=A0A4Y9JE55_9STRE|nr:3-oxoacyl-ACP reductase [Streptococcus cuniculi]MBF0778120.1 3-oxoacyl-ACP reductase [Streptococcus cuniculi]TFU98125.1 3-oxoacyl-ACP reductase [Streptococcus cuniculi]